MKTKTKNLIKKTAGLAAIAGMRAFSGPALLSNYLKDNRSRRIRRSRFAFMQSKKTATILSVLAAGELLGDKIPGVPDRIAPSSLLSRGLSGALVGATLYQANKKNNWEGAGIGFGVAVASTFATFFIRKQLAKYTFIPDPVLGAIEDGLLVGSGFKLLS